MDWNEFNGWTGKYVMKLAGIFNFVEETEVDKHNIFFCVFKTIIFLFSLGLFVQLFGNNSRIKQRLILAASSNASAL